MSRPKELLIDYARGALASDEAVRLEEHLRGCSACRAEVRDVREGFVELVEGLPAAELPTTAWTGIVSRVRRQRLRGARSLAWGVAAALMLLAGAGFWGVLTIEQAGRAGQESEVVARWLAREDVTRVSLGIYPGGGHGSVLMLPDGRSLFVLSDPPERGKNYQAWGHRDGRPVSLGVFDRPVFEVVDDDYEAIGVSLEPRGGSPAPTHPLGRAALP